MLSDKLLELRKEMGVSQKEVAEHLTVGEKAYGYYERGDRTPDYKNLIKIADYFMVSIDYLLGRSNDRRTAQKVKEYYSSNNEILKSINNKKELETLINNIINNYDPLIIKELIKVNQYLYEILNIR